jgi:hypothetical protein
MLAGKETSEGKRMASLVLGVGSSHGPMLSTPPEQWGARVEADRKNPAHHFRGRTHSFEELVALRAAENLVSQSSLTERQARHARCKAAIAQLADAMEAARPDIVLIVGNDQNEIFGESLQPALTVFWGDAVANEMADEERIALMPPGIGISEPGHKPPDRTEYPVHAALARHLIGRMIAAEYDVTSSRALPQEGARWAVGLPHAFGFVLRQIMRDRLVPIVPVILNTFFPPNQPSARRCHRLGAVIAQAIAGFPGTARVAMVASGGLTHFVIDEALDRDVLEAMRRNDALWLEAIPEALLQSGTSEVKNWLPVAGAGAAAGLAMRIVDYVPCYRSEAGTGNAMGFALWQ